MSQISFGSNKDRFNKKVSHKQMNNDMTQKV